MFELHTATSNHIDRLAEIHSDSLPNDFLPSLGRDFLVNQYYPAALASPHGLTLVACKENHILGFATVAYDSHSFTLDVLQGRMSAIALHALHSAIRRPSQLLRSAEVFAAALWPRSNLWPGEIVFISVDQAWRGKGIGHLLIRAALEMLSARGITRCRTKTLAANINVVGLYSSLGWEVIDSYTLIGRDYVVLLSP